MVNHKLKAIITTHLLHTHDRVFLSENLVGGGQDSPHLGKSVGGWKYTPIFGGEEAQFYQFNG